MKKFQNQKVKLSGDHLASRENNQITFECIICFELLDINTACECLECEVAICRNDFEILDQNEQACPNCRSTDGFKRKLSRHHKQKIENLHFVCPNMQCKLTLKYTDALVHIPNCHTEASEIDQLKRQLEVKDRHIQRLKHENIQNHQQILVRTQNFIRNRIDIQKKIIKDDEEFLRQLEFEINQLMINSWPPSKQQAGKIIQKRSRRPSREEKKVPLQQDSKDSVFKGGSSEDWIQDTGERCKVLNKREQSLIRRENLRIQGRLDSGSSQERNGFEQTQITNPSNKVLRRIQEHLKGRNSFSSPQNLNEGSRNASDGIQQYGSSCSSGQYKCANGHILNIEPEKDQINLENIYQKLNKLKNLRWKSDQLSCGGCSVTLMNQYDVGFHFCQERTQGNCQYRMICNICFKKGVRNISDEI